MQYVLTQGKMPSFSSDQNNVMFYVVICIYSNCFEQIEFMHPI